MECFRERRQRHRSKSLAGVSGLRDAVRRVGTKLVQHEVGSEIDADAQIVVDAVDALVPDLHRSQTRTS